MRPLTVCLIYCFFCFLAVCSHNVQAQNEDDPPENDGGVENLVVTGTHIKNSASASTSPVTVITGESILESGFSNLGEALRSLSIAGSAGFNQSSVLNGGGASSVDLRNLGQNRLLILINGKRVASFADALANQFIDLSFVPIAMIDRVDILRDGASAIYGSDAISGVVNVILKERFEGFRAGFSTGLSDLGDGEQYNADLTWGASGARGSIIVGIEHRSSNNISQRDRDWALPVTSELGGGGIRQGTPFSPGGLFIADNGGLFCTTPVAFGGDEITLDPDCPALEFFRGQLVSDPDAVEFLSYDSGLVQDIATRAELDTFAAYGVLDITRHIEGFVEAQHSRRTGNRILDAAPGSFGTLRFPGGSRVPGTNPHLPAGFSGGLFLFRPSSTIGAREADFEVSTSRVVAGFRGELPDFTGMGSAWNWELSYLHTEVESEIDTDFNWNLARFLTIVDPAACALDSLCSQVVNPSGALDVIRPGNWTAAEIGYLRHAASSDAEFRTRGWYGLMSGPVWQLPAGDVQVAIGFETRRDRGQAGNDAVTEAGESISNQVFPTRGSYEVRDVFAEVDVPLLADVGIFQSLDLNAQIRNSHYSIFGEETVERLGLNWQFSNDLRLRVSRSTAYRAPQVTDLFGGGVTTFDNFSIPCSNFFVRFTNPNVDLNCTFKGIALPFRQAAAQFAVLSGANEALEPETADTNSIGLVFTPGFLDGLTVTVDYWDIEVDNLIGRRTSDSIVDACLAGPVGLLAPECDQFDLTLTGAGVAVINMENRLANLDQVSTDGFDAAIQYEFDGLFDSIVNVNFEGTYIKENTFAPGVGGADELGSMPRIKARLELNVSRGDWSGQWRIRYIHSMRDPDFRKEFNAFGYEDIRSHTEHDLTVRLNWRKYNMLFGVNDVFDRDPPYVFSQARNTDLSLYSALGRYFFARFSADF